MNPTVPVNEGNDDVLDIDVLMEFSTGTQERVQGLKVELIWENLTRQELTVMLWIACRVIHTVAISLSVSLSLFGGSFNNI